MWFYFFFSSRRRHTRYWRDWSSDVCSSDLESNGIVEGARGKTGTTSDNRDAWFAGYTPELTTVVWLASVHKKGKRLIYAEMPGATGGHQAAPIWHDFMVQAIPIQRQYNATVQ